MFKISLGILLLLCLQRTLWADLVDPHDINFGSKGTGKVRGSSDGAPGHDCNCPTATPPKDDISFVYLKRVVSLLMTSAVVDRDGGNVRKGRYVLDVDHENYKFLLSFVNSARPDERKFRQLDGVLSAVLHRSVTEDLHEFLLTTQERLIMLLFSPTSLTLYALLVAVYITYHMFQARYSFWYIVRYFIIIVIICDYGMKYKNLLEEAEEQNMKALSPKCKEMGWFDYYFSNKGDCEKKVVTPLDVILLQVQSMIVVPLSSFGTGMGIFAKELFVHLPFPWNFLIFPLMLIFIALLLAIVTTTLGGQRFRVNLMHLLHLEFGGGGRTVALDEMLRAMNHREMVQEVRRSPEKRPAVVEKEERESDEVVVVSKDIGGGGDAGEVKCVKGKKRKKGGKGEEGKVEVGKGGEGEVQN